MNSAMPYNKAIVLCSFIAILIALVNVTEGCVLMKSPWTSDFQDIFSVLFGYEQEEKPQQLKYDRKSEAWVEECPQLDCAHGMDEGDSDACPSCLMGPGESCGDWLGKCGNKMICQYSSMWSSSGKCVLEEEFNSRKVGDACGQYEGTCASGLKCRVDAAPWSFFCGMEEPGFCVTERQFSSRLEGETCGEAAGICKEGLTCFGGDFCLTQSTCKDLTKDNSEEQGRSFDEIIYFSSEPSSSQADENGEEFVTIEVFDESDGKEPKESDFSESLIEFEEELFPDVSTTLLNSEEVGLIERIIESVSTSNCNETIGEKTVEILEIPKAGGSDKEITITFENSMPINSDELNINTIDDEVKITVDDSNKEDSLPIVLSGKSSGSSTLLLTKESSMVLPEPGKT